jgi:ABC-type lipoprotein export system ATPase subunit
LIRISNLVFSYPEGEFRLEIPSLAVERGTTAAVIGPSGCGKTTLLNLMAGVTQPTTGRVITNEVEVTSLSDAERRNFRIRNIGLVFQEFELLEYLTVLDNILLPYRINTSMELDKTVRDRAVEIAKQVDIGDKLNRYATKLSQGEKQRVAVCRALLPDPVLLLADEPTGNLDPSNKGRVLDILLDYAARTGATLVTVTHDYDLIDRFSRVIDFRDFYSGLSGGEEMAAKREIEMPGRRAK